MKNYIVVWECNQWGSFRKLEGDDRKLIETKFNGVYHLADLFKRLNSFLEGFQRDFYPEVIAIREV